MSGGGNDGIIGGTTSGRNFYIDLAGEADLSFHGVPLNTIKKAQFLNKLSIAKSLLKMVVNGATYDFQKTAQNGAVIFRSNYGMWDFMAPDGRFDFSKYAGMTVGDALLDMESILTTSPIPAWDSFFVWLNDNMSIADVDTSNMSSCYFRPIIPPDETQDDILADAVQGNLIDLGALTDSVSFIQSVEYAIAPLADMELSVCMTSENAFGFMLLLCTINEETGVEQVTIPLSFQFCQ